MTSIQKLTKARGGLILDHAFFGSLALKLRLQEDCSCKTAWTDGDVIGYNPSAIEEWPLEEVKGVFCHEVMHCALLHHARREERDPARWNVACDYAINGILREAGIVLPKGHLFDASYRGLSADEIYSRLPDQSKGQGANGQGGSGSGDPDPGGCGEVRDAKSPDGKNASQSDFSKAAEDWKIAVTQAAQLAKAMGSLPAGFERLVREIVEPQVDWRTILRRFVEDSARNDYSWFPPNRRYIHMGLYLPSLKSEELPPIVFALDTSISVSKKDLSHFAAEITATLEDFRTSCTVIYCDTKVASVEVFGQDDLPLELHPKGGGGTDFRPPFAWVDEQRLSPSCFIYLTDMGCSRFPDTPPYPVLWAAVGCRGKEPKVPFGELVKIN